MNLNYIAIQRSRYTFLDVLSDIGGIQSMIAAGLSFLVGFWNY